jgi:V8-like Glu-specific endopeptidase
VEFLDRREVLSASPLNPVSGLAASAVVNLKVTFPDHQTVLGTGAMIDSYHVLTAAHMLYSAADGGYATSIVAAPGANGASTPFGVAYGTKERVDPSWLSFSQAHPGSTSPSVEDLGLITLDRTIGNSTGWFTIGYNNNNSFFKNATFQTAGYPSLAGVNAAKAVMISGKSQSAVSPYGVTFKQSALTASSGQSGSPVWKTSGKGSPLIYAVVTGANGFSDSNSVYATRITRNAYNELLGWKRSDRTPFPNQIGVPLVAHPAVSGVHTALTSTSTVIVQALDDYEFDGGYGYADNSGYTDFGGYNYDDPGYMPSTYYYNNGYDNGYQYTSYATGTAAGSYSGYNQLYNAFEGWGLGTIAGYGLGLAIAPEFTLPLMIWGGAFGGVGGYWWN